jgi:hypothetical protein
LLGQALIALLAIFPDRNLHHSTAHKIL